MLGCKSPSLTCLQGPGAAVSGKPPPSPPAAPTESAATLHKLALATGGTEKSWYRCVFPFGIVSLVIGVAATCITFSINGPRMDIAKVVSVAALLFGLALLAAALLCWRDKRRRQQQQRHTQTGPAQPGAL
nr:PREDICTED: transmembrane protein 100-like [Anolis carolinensis]|eukprot:XP_008122313.1 PREDICTED: transmembrane protein 100-like [Anolis carolinensis]